MQTPTLTAGKRVSPKNDFAKKAAEQPTEQKKFNDDDDDFDDDFSDDSLDDDLDYDSAGSFDDEEDEF